MASLQASRGTRDILPPEVQTWQAVETEARLLLQQAAFQEIRTPLFEQTELFARGIGEGTDIVSKEMYTFLDRGERSLTLRPEGTAGVVRAYIEHGLAAQGGVQRLWYLGPMFRYERPQAGRQRQFHQLGIEVLGSADPRADVEVIALAISLLTRLGLTDLKLEVNSVGEGVDRQHYREALVAYLEPHRDSLDPDSQKRLTQNPLRILDSKDPRTQAMVANAPSLLAYLSPTAHRHLEQVQQGLSDLGIPHTLNPRLVRGLDYYTHTAFEIQSEHLGAQATVCGGGRYDGLVAQLGGPPTPAVGWALGLERLVLLTQKQGRPAGRSLDIYMASRGPTAERQALVLAQALRQQGWRIELDLSGSAFSKQLKRADRSGAPLTLILGEAEAQEGTVQAKWLTSGEQQLWCQADLLEGQATLQRAFEAILSKP